MSRTDQVATSATGRLFRGQTAIDFYDRRKVGLVLAVVVIVVTFGSLFTRGLDLGLDFEGGQAWDIPAGETFGVDQAEAVLEDNGVAVVGSKIQTRSSDDDSFVTVQIEEVPTATADQLTADFASAAGVGVDDVSFSFTSASWGGDITAKAVRALVIFLIIVSIFISIRFEFRMALAALGAMAHDVILAVGVYTVFQFEVTPATVIAYLTILGYSLYDTIVVFDRIQENEGKYAGVRMPYPDIVNISMNQVLMRSINTSLSSILPVVSLLLIGSGLLGAVTLREFALALLVGMIAGVYSSIFVAAPILAALKANVGRAARRERLTGDELRAAVIGAGVSGRVVSEDPTAVASGDRSDPSDRDEAVASSGSIQRNADQILSHPPRPRKKKRR